MKNYVIPKLDISSVNNASRYSKDKLLVLPKTLQEEGIVPIQKDKKPKKSNENSNSQIGVIIGSGSQLGKYIKDQKPTEIVQPVRHQPPMPVT